MNLPEKVTARLRELPDKPGCYLMRDARGRIIYVGKAASLRKRVQSYFRAGTLRSATPKLRGMVKSIADFDFIVVGSEAEAILTEGRLIKDYRPRYNVSFRDDKRFLLIRVELAAAFPRFELCRIRRDGDATYFGPYASSGAARATIDFVEKRFGLRKCTPAVPGEEDHKHCINDIVRFCAAPCIGKVDAEGYARRVEEACAFLRGENREALRELRAAMLEAGGKRDFERAAVLRDTLFSLERAIQRRSRMTSSTGEMSADVALRGLLDLQKALALPRLPDVIEAFDISNISGTYAVASMVCAVHGLPNGSRYKRFRIRTVVGSDDPRMMAEVVSRRYTRLRNDGSPLPDLVLIDGGITQLRAAREQLSALGLADLPSAGLAKRFEEIHRFDGEAPVRLPKDSPALKVLQRIRDEAHRFALTYHRHLRGKRIRESVLDDIPGVGEKRKAELLRRFGSLRRLAAATEEEVATVPGVGRRLAQQILTEARKPAAEATDL